MGKKIQVGKFQIGGRSAALIGGCVLAAVLAIFAIVVALQPVEFQIARTTTIAAPPRAAFDQVNDLRKWDAWSPWAKLDPAAKVSFEGAKAGTGAVFKWSGTDKIGEGKMTVTESKPASLIKLKVDFTKPFEGGNVSEFSFKPEGKGTAVTWSMSGRNDNFFAKAACLVMNMQASLGGEMEKGLAQMKSVVEGRGAFAKQR
jgi:hypothetical protein